MAVRVILQENYPSLGYVGDVVSVKPGYARNFLVPKGIAVEASSKNGKLIKHRMAGIQAKRTKLKAQAEEFGNSLVSSPLDFILKTGEAGKAYGAITTKDIEGAFKTKGIELSRKQIRLLEPIKMPGSYKVDIKVHAEVVVAVPVNVTAEVKAEKKEAAGKGAKGGAKGARKAGPGRGRKKSEEAADTAVEEDSTEE